MRSSLFKSIFLIILLVTSTVLVVSPVSNKAYAQNEDVFLKSITRIPGGAVFDNPLGVAVDSSGNIYVADAANYRVAEFASSGTFIKSFGVGELNTTSGVAVDSSGNVYASDSDNNDTAEFASSGTFIKSFGSTAPGGLSSPQGVAVDSSGNVYVADSGNARIAEFTSSGSYVQSFTSGLSSPSGVAVDSSKNVYVSDSNNNDIVEFSNSGASINSFNNGLSSPSGVALDSSGNVYVADNGNGQLVEFSNSGSTTINSFTSGLPSPRGVAVDSSGNVYASDNFNNNISEFSNSGASINSFGSYEALLLDLPSNVALSNNGDIFVVDNGNNRILVFDNTGNFLFSFGSQGAANGQFINPFGIAFDSSDNIYVVDRGNDRVEKFSNTGSFLSAFGTTGTGNGNLNNPLGIAINSVGNIFVADANNKRIEEFSSAGNYVAKFGVGTLQTPSGVVFNAAGNFYTSDRVNNLVYEFNSINGAIINKFPNSNTTGLAPLNGPDPLDGPYGIGFDFPGNLHIADSNDNRVVVLSSTGQLVTQFGSHGTTAGDFDGPEGLAIDASGNIYVADTSNNRVEVFSPTVPPATSITLNSPTPSSVRWGLDTVSISGHATSLSTGDTITVNWGDGSTTTGIPVSVATGNWGPVTHTYLAAASGQTEQVVGSVIDSTNTLIATSTPVSVNVLAHHTSLTINNISNVLFGGQITATGVLTDTDASTGIADVPISFSGSGIAILSPATTASNGAYSSTGTAISSLLSGLLVTANFAGNSQYLTSSATSSPFSTTQHHVTLYLQPIPNSPWSSTITISGTLNDTDGGNAGVNGESITIGGNGVTGTKIITTSTISGKPGSFSTTATAPSTPTSGLAVTATFIGNSNYIATSASTSYSTIPHSTSLTLNPISNVPAGTAIVASGTLTDTSVNMGIVGGAITFNGTGVGTITGTSTSGGGSYSSPGNAPNSILSGLTLEANYAGNSLYNNAKSTIQTYSTGGAPSVSINTPVISNTLGNNQARWGIDTVSINGTASNTASGDTITVTWGDSASTNNIPISSGKWGPLSHIYGAGAVGTNHILASLISSSNVNKAVSAPLSISVIQHTATLTLNPISNVGVGGTITVTGRLTDTNANVGISGQPVAFNGTGVGTLATVSTNSTGYYTATGTAPNTPTTGLTLQARFTGNLDLFPSSSTIQIYNTVAITSPPEGFNQFDPVSKDVLVYGVDSTGKVFGPIKPQTVTTTTWGYDDDKGGDHESSQGSNHESNQGDHDNNQYNQGDGQHHNTDLLYQEGSSQYSNIDYRSHPEDHSKTGNQYNHQESNQGDDQYYPGNDHHCDGLTAQLRTFDIVDSAGNSLVLTEKVVITNGEIDVHVISLKYNQGPILPAPINLKHFTWSQDGKGNIQELDQTMIVGQFTSPTTYVHAEFSAQTDKTDIQLQQFCQHAQNIVKNGLDLIKMLTTKGSLTVQY
ncbi:MAG: 6-bladed beta-propeller [Nitrosotalea sp.]